MYVCINVICCISNDCIWCITDTRRLKPSQYSDSDSDSDSDTPKVGSSVLYSHDHARTNAQTKCLFSMIVIIVIIIMIVIVIMIVITVMIVNVIMILITVMIMIIIMIEITVMIVITVTTVMLVTHDHVYDLHTPKTMATACTTRQNANQTSLAYGRTLEKDLPSRTSRQVAASPSELRAPFEGGLRRSLWVLFEAFRKSTHVGGVWGTRTRQYCQATRQRAGCAWSQVDDALCIYGSFQS